ncbi:MAG: hypothetical protein ACI4QI_07800, partial [Candidatus Coproplasma sp.]
MNYIKEDEDICAVCAGLKTSHVFFVYQGKTYNTEFNGGYIKAPANTHVHHWERLIVLKKGDIIQFKKKYYRVSC